MVLGSRRSSDPSEVGWRRAILEVCIVVAETTDHIQQVAASREVACDKRSERGMEPIETILTEASCHCGARPCFVHGV